MNAPRVSGFAITLPVCDQLDSLDLLHLQNIAVRVSDNLLLDKRCVMWVRAVENVVKLLKCT
jgi:hypothetical protein